MVVKPDAVIDVPGDFVVTSAGDESVEHVQPVKLLLGTGGGQLGTVRAQGDIFIQGHVYGKGSLIANRDVVMLPNNVAVETDFSSDLAVYARRNVVILDEQNSGDSHRVSFKGLIYAGENFYFRSDTNLEVEGALVARNGHVYLIAGTADFDQEGHVGEIHGTHDLTVTYNPDYLDSLLATSAQERTKVELMAWRPGL
jgi:hypothetical protein